MSQPTGARPDTLDRIVCGVICALAGTYLVARAIWVPLTYDEAASLVRYVRGDLGALLDFGVATNHLLNSVLTRLSHAVFGDAPWALRLPNVLAGLAFLALAARLAVDIRERAIGLAGLVLLAANPYLLDYLSLSRGYGLAIALVTAGLVWLRRWSAVPATSAAAPALLRGALGWTALAVLANFATLPVFLAVAGVATLRLVWTTRGSRLPATASLPGWSTDAIVTWAIVTLLYSALVFGREPALSPGLFAPVRVEVAGLLPAERDTIAVYHVNRRGRPIAFERGDDGAWHSGSGRDIRGLRIELPVAADQNLASLNVYIGGYRFERTRRHPGPWHARDIGASRILTPAPELAAPRRSNPALEGVINWRPGRGHTWHVLRYAGLTLTGLLILGTVVALARRLIVRAGWLPATDALALTTIGMLVASVVSAPVFLLRRNAELYFGGTTGLFSDTFGSLVRGTAYGVVYHPDQERFVAIGVALAAVALAVSAVAARRAGDASRFVPPLLAGGVVGLVAAQAAAQHLLLGTPYLTGRTAITLLPWLLAFVTLTADAVASLGRGARLASTSVMVGLALAASLHAVSTFNLWRTLDWQADAATPAMIAAVTRDASGKGTPPHLVRIGVEWMFLPVAQYYAERASSDALRVEAHVVPGDEPTPDYLYVRQSSDLGSGAVLDRFAESGAVLWRPRP